jgi:hypothetical protein
MYHVFTRGHNREVMFGERFARKVRGRLKVGRETGGRRELGKRIEFDGIVQIVERLKKAKWDDFRDQRGDPGRDLVLWAARRYGGMPLRLRSGLRRTSRCSVGPQEVALTPET